MDIMKRMIANDWKNMLIFGVLALVVGIIAIVYPGITLGITIILLGAFALLSGLSRVINGTALPKGSRAFPLLEGILYIILAIIMIMTPLYFAEVLVYIMAAFLIIMGLFQIFGLIFVAGTGSKGDSLFPLITGIISLILGCVIAIFPAQTIEVSMWIIGAFLILIGIINIAGGLKIKKVFS
ncbi:HdeD family acid-resistance protein [Candidatus Methanomassiliicoccus intestinalis]|uniref:Acid-resistance membrane protein n=1 Tax=Candidatus Methanomassiliicoccus intestinalis TaxID=1406512 RepID=A0A8J8PFZ7_9ARCH|nr:MAG: hypothetical protein A3207_03435 [Candidatus Methanomassiliicoccus intestinalis]